MKKKLIGFLIMTLSLSPGISSINATKVQAATNDNSNVSSTNSSNSVNNENAIKISLANIKDIIIQNNQQAKIYDNNRNNTKLVYDDAKTTYDDAKTAYDALSNKNTIESAYNTAKDAYNTATAAYEERKDNTEYDSLKDAYDKAKAAYETAKTAYDTKNTYDSAKNTLESDRYALKTANIKYEQNLETLVKQAQTDYISYVLNDLSNKTYNTANVQLLKKAADAAKVQYDMGFLSKNDYTTAQLNYTNALNASNTSNDTEANDKAKLLYDLGISSEENVIFDTNLEQDLKDVSTINYDNDLTQMFDNNLTLQEDNINIDQASDNKDSEDDNNTDNENDIIDNKLENAQAQLVLDKNNAEKDFKTKYDALMNSYAAMKSSADSLKQQQNNDNVTQVQYDYGFASQQSVDESKVNSLKSSESYQKDKSTFYANYLSYIEMKEGY